MLLFRPSIETQAEYEVVQKYFEVAPYRSLCRSGLVVGRYSVLPYYMELEADLARNGAYLINGYEDHRYIADFDWYFDVKEATPETWFDYNFNEAPEGPFIVKGRTNSRKFKWSTECYANSKREAIDVANKLSGDSLIGPQGIIYRRYVPLETYEIGINGLPMTNEWRFFYLGRELLSYGYYWSIAENVNPPFDEKMGRFADQIARIIARRTEFFVLDIAKTQAGGYTLIEVNDGQMSGLSENDPEVLYRNLRVELGKQYDYK